MLRRLFCINNASRSEHSLENFVALEDPDLGCLEITHTIRACATTELDADFRVEYTPTSAEDDPIDQSLDVDMFRGHGKDTPFVLVKDALQEYKGLDTRTLIIDLQVRDWGNGPSLRLQEVMETISAHVDPFALKRVVVKESKQLDHPTDFLFRDTDEKSIVTFSTIFPLTAFPNLAALSIEVARQIRLGDAELIQLVQSLPELTTLRLNLAGGWCSLTDTQYVVPTLTGLLTIMEMRRFRDIAITLDGDSIGRGIKEYRLTPLDLKELESLQLDYFVGNQVFHDISPQSIATRRSEAEYGAILWSVIDPLLL
ncbi:hypothetical protein CONPUDRAFT_70425 [Coniophora puteana RWD-64-598 SS2]|uniref:Uncharacterized protein n=1 Tax=Coniophora puteana (strain RWD-64-598) TaxID=741705 RepID=A0A5M3N2X8_CONPW|nr:uncharacterized protein CONPUDRAFT_70425 [Coniophora puteana RWD-64-598 SS2]EIW85676.1 hypothetical protein CONPUDRAFT_70425 [Coniophora puteana RWD-64-598 SS2]